MTYWELKEGDTLPSLTKTGLDTEKDPTGASVEVIVQQPNGGDVIINDTGSIDDTAQGDTDVSYALSSDQTGLDGQYNVEWVITYDDAESNTQTFPSGKDYDTLTIGETLNRTGSPVSASQSAILGAYDAFDFNRLSEDPNAAAVDDLRLFVKSDGILYKIDENGTVTAIGADSNPAVEDDGVEIVGAVSVFNFAGSQFDVTNPTGDEVQVVIDTDAIGLDELDQSISPTWTSPHTFEDYLDLDHITEPSNPGASAVRLWAEDEGGHTVIHHKNSAGIDREVGRDIYHIVRNESGSGMSEGDVVYVTGSNGNFPTVGLADASSSATMPAFGILAEDTSNNDFGIVYQYGDLSLDTTGFSDGDELFVSASTPGAFTTTAPSGSDIRQRVGVVVKGGVGGGIVDAEVAAEIDPSLIPHDHLNGYVANEHVDHSTVSISSGTGLSGGGDITASRTLTLDEVVLKDGGAKELDAAELAAALGTNGQVLQSDGAAAAWATLVSGDLSDFDEAAQDAVGTILGSLFTYDDVTPQITLDEGEIDHDALTNFVANEHIDHSTVDITAGNALTGGGDLTTSRTLAVDESAIDIANLAGVLADALIKSAGDDLSWNTDANDDLILENDTDGTTLLTWDQDTGDITFEQLTGTPSFGSHDHSEGGLSTIPNAGLANSTVTVAGNSVALGGSTAVAHGDLSDAPEEAHHPRGGFDAPLGILVTSYTANPWEDLWIDTGTAGGAVTITLPADADVSDGDRVEVSVEDASHNTDVSPNTGQSVLGPNPSLTQVGDGLQFVYRASDSTWMVK